MKKKLEAELISIAHRILKLKNKEDVRELHHEAQKLYEKLSVLLFVEENFDTIKPTIGLHDIEEKIAKAFDLEQRIEVPEMSETDEESITENKIKPISIINNIMDQWNHDENDNSIHTNKSEPEEPIIAFDEAPVIEIPKAEKKQTTIDELLESVQSEPVFERVNKEEKKKDSSHSEQEKQTLIPEEITKIIDEKVAEVKANTDIKIETKFVDLPKTQDFIFDKVDGTNLNDKLKKSINIGLNDRLAFEKNLFGGSSEDFNRVISQLSTFDSLEDAKNFINEMVKPDYDYWKGKEEFADRFMEIVENKFI